MSSEARLIQWMSLRNNDGRRPSGNGYNVSAIHVGIGDNPARSICGREVQIPTSGHRFLQPVRACSACYRKWGRRYAALYEKASIKPPPLPPVRITLTNV